MEIGSRVQYVGREVVETSPLELGTVIGVRNRGFANYYEVRWDGASESWHWPAALQEASVPDAEGRS